MKRARICLVVSMLALLSVTSVQAAASTVTTVETIPFSTIVTGCGEDIAIDGEIQVVFHVTMTPRGGFLLQELFHPQGLTGTGLQSGATYHAVGASRDTTTVRATAGSTFTLVNNFKIIGEGQARNYLVHETLHVTVNANGEVTANADHFSVECRG
jgi:hypothetical protein